MSNTRPGLYDTLITEALSATLATLEQAQPVSDTRIMCPWARIASWPRSTTRRKTRRQYSR